MLSKFVILCSLIYITYSLPIKNPLIGGCDGTLFGCCKNTTEPCSDISCHQCPNTTLDSSDLIGGCDGTLFGCCKNTTEPCSDISCKC